MQFIADNQQSWPEMVFIFLAFFADTLSTLFGFFASWLSPCSQIWPFRLLQLVLMFPGTCVDTELCKFFSWFVFNKTGFCQRKYLIASNTVHRHPCGHMGCFRYRTSVCLSYLLYQTFVVYFGFNKYLLLPFCIPNSAARFHRAPTKILWLFLVLFCSDF